jgi:hypothetical protein
VRDDLVRRRRSPFRLIFRGVGIADKGRVVSPYERAVKRRADASIGLRADDHESTDGKVRVRDHRVALMGPGDDAFLHVYDEERGVRPVLERGHGLPFLAWGTARPSPESRCELERCFH